MPTQLSEIKVDLIMRGHLDKGLEKLTEEFSGIFGPDTIDRYMAESLSQLGAARVSHYIPLFVHRFARQRLRALAQADEILVKDVPEVLFVCVENAGRSQMAAGLLDKVAEGRVHVRTAGSDPASEINPAAVAAMAEVGVDLTQEFPKPLTDEFVRAADAVITMGCGDACPIYPGKHYEDWELEDPAGKDIDTVRRIRDEIEQRVRTLLDQIAPASLLRRAAAEGLATFALVFAGCGAIVADAQYGGALGTVGIALVFGLIIMAMIYATSHLSGAHINPAVTIAFALTRHFPARDAAAYIPAQVAGAVAGALALLAIWPDQPAALGATLPSIGVGGAFVYEVILTAFLMFVIVSVATDTRAVGAAAAIAIGGTVGLDALFGGPVTGASMNPARSLGPALAAGEWTDLWIYLAAPVLGAAVGAVAYQLVRGEPQASTARVRDEGND